VVDRWEETGLWGALGAASGEGVEVVRSALRIALGRVETVIRAGGASPKDFTLHDEFHAVRVAELMVRIVPDEVLPRLSAYELALLLLSAYLHDVGMSPRYGLVSAHHEFLLTGQSADLSADQARTFQLWLDQNHDGLEPPLAIGPVTVEDLRRANLLISHYVRRCHVDWGDDWTRAELADCLRFTEYTEFLNDLIQLCRSHHEGFGELASDRFAPRFIHGGHSVVHLRYLAAVLRVADVLDVDPERTPQILFTHRSVSPHSVIYWYKDHELRLSVESDGRVVAEARPSSAVAYRAIEQTVDGIEDELRLCRDLDAITPFRIAPRRNRELPHRWKLEPVVYRDIRPRDERFVYVDGAFRPNTDKLLQLLGGKDLYGDPLFAIRELVQNSYDAVRERLAWQRLRQSNPLDEPAISALQQLHRVELTTEDGADGRQWLVCRDTGAGMTRDILMNYLLVSGSGRHPDLFELSRRCEKAGFELERSGKFGIGVLSYFMIADRLELRTRRCLEALGGEAEAWYFETDGVGSFGELRRDLQWTEGTEVRLRLRPNLASPASLKTKLAEMVICTPCVTTFSSAVNDKKPLILGQGRTTTPEQLTQVLLASLREYRRQPIPKHLRGGEEYSRTTRYSESLEKARKSAAKATRWKVVEGELEGRTGRYRICLPYFALPGGIALVIMNIAEDSGRIRCFEIGRGQYIIPHLKSDRALDGILLPPPPPDELDHMPRSLKGKHYLGQIDWRTARTRHVSLRRTLVTPSTAAESAHKGFRKFQRDLILDFLRENSSSVYARLNRHIAEVDIESIPISPSERWWLSYGVKGELLWRELHFPATDSTFRAPGRSFRLGGVSVDTILTPGHRALGLDSPQRWWLREQSPARLCVEPDGSRFAQVFESHLVEDNPVAFGLATSFPPGASRIVLVNYWWRGNIFNADHPLVTAATREEVAAWGKRLDDRLPIGEHRGFLTTRSQTASWLLAIVRRLGGTRWSPFNERNPADPSAYWTTIVENDPSLITEVLQIVFDRPDKVMPLCIIDQSSLRDLSEGIVVVDDEYDSASTRAVILGPYGASVTGEGDLGETVLRLWSQPGWYLDSDAGPEA
jgi:Histidine kinase-, DNA gyrase B-, and HSP90-like ATPase